MSNPVRHVLDKEDYSEHFSTEHFDLWARSRSFAASNLTLIATRLETAYSAVTSKLELKTALPQKILVLFSDEHLPALPDTRLVGGPNWEMHIYYRPDSPAPQLELEVAALLLASASNSAPNYSRFALDGIVGWSMSAPGSTADATLSNLRRQGESIHLADVISGPRTDPDPGYTQIAESFVRFLCRRYGPDLTVKFAVSFNPVEPSSIDSVFGKPLAILEIEWISALAEIKDPDPGLMGFLVLAFGYLQRQWMQLSALFTAVVFTMADPVLRPMLFRSIMDDAVMKNDGGRLVFLIGQLLALLVFQAIANLVREYLSARLGASLMGDQPVRLFRHLQRLSLQYYQGARANEIAGRMGAELDDLEKGLVTVLVQASSLLLSITISLGILTYVNWRLTLIGLAFLSVILLGPKYLTPLAEGVKKKRTRAFLAADRVMVENLGAQGLVRTFGLEQQVESRYKNLVDDLAAHTIRHGLMKGLVNSSVLFSGGFVQVSVFVSGALMAVNGSLTLGSMYLFTALFGRNVVPSVQSLSQMGKALKSASGALRFVKETLEEPPGVIDGPNATNLELPITGIEVKRVTFSYTGDQVNLKDISLTLPGTGIVGIVGPSGAGKSTLTNLLLRLYDPNLGEIRINGQDLRQISVTSLRSHTAAVMQDAMLFNTTIAENIRAGHPGASMEEIVEAARLAGIHDFVSSLAQGYDTQVGERGGRLSGGQRQRLAIARALIKNPAILLLDEATSALDPETESLINATLVQLARTRLVVVITHRLHAAASADLILVIDRGQVAEQGTHKQLQARNGLYCRLWQYQHASTLGTTEPWGFLPETLRALPLFKPLEDHTINWMAKQFTVEEFAAGDVVVQQGDPGDKFYILTQGTMDVVLTTIAGEERRLATLQEGSYFGEMALIQDLPRSATIRARSPSRVLALGQAEFNQMLFQAPQLKTAIVEVMESRRRANTATLQNK